MGGSGGSQLLRRARLVIALSLCAAAVVLAIPAASASADVTLGSPLEHGYEATFGGSTETVYQEAAPSETLLAPADGTITSWTVRSGDVGAQYQLRVIRPGAAGMTAAGTSATQIVSDSEDKIRGPFTVNLPVRAGDRVALDVIGGTGAPINNTLAPAADELNYLQDPFTDGATAKPVLTPPLGGSQELLLQANFKPSAPGGGGGTGGPGSVAGPPPTPSLGATTLKGRLAFSAARSAPGSSAITGYEISLHDSAGNATIDCGPSSPVVVPQFSTSVTGTATLTVKAADGQTATTSAPFSAAGVPPLHHPRGAARSAALLTPSLYAYQCLPADAHALAGTEVAGAAPGVSISSSCEMDAGIVHVQGCGLQPVSDLCSLPASERGMVEAHLIPSGAAASRLQPCGGLNPLFTASNPGAHASRAPISSRAEERLLGNLVDTFYVSTEPVRVNGIDIVPHDGAAVVIAVGGLFASSFTKQYGVYLISKEASEQLGGFALQKGKLDLDVSGLGAAETQFAAFKIQNPITFGRFTKLAVGALFSQLGGVPSLPLTGGFEAVFARGGVTKININLEVSKLFNNPLNDLPFTGATTLIAENGRGLVLGALDINVPDLDLGVVDLSNIKLHWDRATDSIAGQIAVDVKKELGGAIGGSFAFQGGNFLNGSLFYQADELDSEGGGGYLITPPIWLINLSATFSLYQRQVPGSTTSWDGQSTLSVGPAVSNNGCGLLQANGDVHMRFYPGPFELSLSGTDELLCIPLQQSYFSANADGYARVGGGYELDVPEVFHVKTNLDGQAYVDLNNPLASHFQLDGSANATLDLPDPIGHISAGAEAVISDLGAGICTDVSVLGHDFHPGVTESFRPTPPFTPVQFLAQLSLAGDGCSLSPYQPLGKGGAPGGAASVRAHRASQSFTIPPGEASATVMLHGQGGAPSVVLKGPGGRTIDTATDGASPAGDLVLRQRSTGTTLVEIEGANAGSWTITPDPGSVPITGAFTAHELPKPSITARVGGSGAKRVLRYRIKPQPGLSVSFVETGGRGGQRLGTAKGSSGRISFVPAGSAAGTRTITAVLSQNGLPRPGFVVARYRSGIPRPGRVHSIVARRSRGGLLVSFSPAPLAQRYLAAVSLSNGRSVVVPSRGAGPVFIPEIPAGIAITRVGVVALRGELRGRLTLARIRRRH